MACFFTQYDECFIKSEEAIVIQVLNHHVIPEIFYRESNDRSSIQAFEDDDWAI